MLGKTRIAWVSLFLLGTCLFFACQDDIPGAEDLPPPDAALVAPPTFVGNTLPLRLLQNMYGDVDGLCWTESTADFDAETRKLALGWDGNDPIPTELRRFLESRTGSPEDGVYRLIGPRRLLLLSQELVRDSKDRVVPSAWAVEIFRMQGSDGQVTWQDGDAASVGPCD